MEPLRQLTDRLNRRIYDISRPMTQLLQRFSILSALIGLGLLVLYVGFPLEGKLLQWCIYAMDVALFFFTVEFVLRWILELNRWQFFKRFWWQAIMALLTLMELASTYVGDQSLLGRWISHGNSDYHIILQFFLFTYSISWLIYGLQQIISWKIRPALLFVLSFVGIILIGSLLLILPEMTTSPSPMSWIDAFFTATSATCVTGLIVVDTGTYFTLKGQLVILLLIQLGGLGIIVFASFFALILRQGIGVKERLLVKDVLNADSVRSSVQLIKPIIFYTLIIELLGAVLIYLQWGNDPQYIFNQGPWWHKAYYAVFHSVSAFCNAGFSLFSNSLMHQSIHPYPGQLFTFAILIILGGVGFPVLQDIFSRSARSARKKLPWKKYQLNTRVVIITSAALILMGWLFFALLEYDNTLAEMPWYQQLAHSFFQSVTTRTAGFNSVPIEAIGMPTLLMFLLLMLIGGSSGGTAGGIKTTTFVLLMQSVFTTIRGHRQVLLWKRAITTPMLYRAVSIFAFAILFIFLACFVMLWSETGKAPMDLIFEVVSAFGTVGLSRGVTADLSAIGKWTIILTMFAGRVGLLTIAFALSRPAKSSRVQYPEGHLMVG